MLGEDGIEHNELKGKGIPSRVLKASKTFEDYKLMLTEPRKDWVEFRRIGSKRLRLTHFAQRKTGLGPYDDKIYQFDAWHSRPLGHWRNREEDGEITGVSPPILMAPKCSFDDVGILVPINDEPEDEDVADMFDSADEDIEDLFDESDAE